MSKKGVDILLLANTGTEQSPVFTPVGGQRNATLSETNDTFETTNKLSPDRAREFESSFYSWTISADGVHVAGEEAYEKLKECVRTGEKILVQIDDGGLKEQGLAIVTSRELEGPYDGESTYSMELQGTGPLTPVTGS
jgi:TP901-1 family phage major tail protein